MMKHKSSPKDNGIMPIIFGMIYLIMSVLVRILSGSPYEVLHKIDTSNIMPPIWIFNLLTFIFCFICGYASGIVVSNIICKKVNGDSELYAYRGGICFVALIFISLMWYPVLFSCEALFISLILSILSFLLSVCTAYLWSCVCKKVTIIMTFFSLWQFYIFITNLLLILKN